MALNAAVIWALNAGATAGMLNGGGFNTANANFIADWTTDANTANTASPVLSSASYNFVAGDVGAWIYVKSGTNWTPGFYQIASVASNKATLSAAIGAGLIANAVTGLFDTPNTAAGIATVGTPTAGTLGVDYSQGTTAIATATDYASVGSSVTLTSVSAGFRASFVGNVFHLTTTGTGAFGLVGWYELVTYVNTTTMTTDRTTNNGTALASGTGYCGGALDLNGAATVGTAFGSQTTAGQQIFQKGGATYTITANTSFAGSGSTTVLPIMWRPFKTLRGDVCVGADRPIMSMGGTTFTILANGVTSNIIVTGTAASLLAMGNSSILVGSKVINTSTTADRVAVTMGTDTTVYNCEIISQFGTGISQGSQRGYLFANYIHDCKTGSIFSTFGQTIVGNIYEGNYSIDVSLSSSSASAELIANNTFYGAEAKLGTAINLAASAPTSHIFSNLIYGKVTGISQATTQSKSNFGAYNDFFNNTTDVSNYYKDSTDTAVNPSFTNISQVTSSTGSTSGSVWTDANANYSTVTDSVDYAYVSAGTGKTVGKYLITAHTSTTLTFNVAPGTNATADGVLSITIGHNLLPTGAV